MENFENQTPSESETKPQLTDEEQKKVTEEREALMQEDTDIADRENEQRSLKDKVLGKNKLSAVDIAHENAFSLNAEYDRKKISEEIDREAAEARGEVFDEELKLARTGSWNGSKSRLKHPNPYWFRDDSERRALLTQLETENSQFLQKRFAEETQAIADGVWNEENSFFDVAYSHGEVNDLSEKKYSMLQELKELEDLKKSNHRKEKLGNIKKDLEETFEKEKQMIESGALQTEHSSFIELLGNKDYDISSTARKYLEELKGVEQRKLSEEIEGIVDAKYAEEKALIKQGGQWEHKTSYMYTIQQGEVYKKLTSTLKSKIVQRLADLTTDHFHMNFGGGEEFQDEGGFEEGVESSEKEIINKVVGILGLSSGATQEEAKKAYRRFMSKNHHDHNPEGDSDAVGFLTQNYKKLEAHLKAGGAL